MPSDQCILFSDCRGSRLFALKKLCYIALSVGSRICKIVLLFFFAIFALLHLQELFSSSSVKNMHLDMLQFLTKRHRQTAVYLPIHMFTLRATLFLSVCN